MSLYALDLSRKPPVPPPSPPPMDSRARRGRRSRRRGGGGFGGAESEEEYLALCLLMLARGVRGEAENGGGFGGGKGVGAAVAAAKASPQQGYECSVCGKVYGSYQALGGHKTRHRKPPTPPPAVAAGDEASGGSGIGIGEGKVHQCSLCLRTFPSGQALGGHKRLHYEGGAAAEGIKDKEDAKEKSVAATAVLMDFDLNLPAAATMGGEAESAPPEAKRARTMLLVV